MSCFQNNHQKTCERLGAAGVVSTSGRWEDMLAAAIEALQACGDLDVELKPKERDLIAQFHPEREGAGPKGGFYIKANWKPCEIPPGKRLMAGMTLTGYRHYAFVPDRPAAVLLAETLRALPGEIHTAYWPTVKKIVPRWASALRNSPAEIERALREEWERLSPAELAGRPELIARFGWPDRAGADTQAP